MLTTIKHKKQSVLSGFTIIELLVVMVVIGILAGITAVSFNGIKQKAVESSIKSDLNGAGKELEMIKTVHGSYPNDLNCNAPDGINTYCPPGGVVGYEYHTSTDRQSYSLSKNIENNRLAITNNGLPINCPAGFIIVPGSETYGTSDFCVMKYEAKRVGTSNVPISQASGNPWSTITFNEALDNSKKVEGCSNCNLIKELEWMTIAQNVLNVPSNWNSNIVGSGYIYRGHSNNIPAGHQEADTDDNNGYTNTNNAADQKRTLFLNNGEIIWDLAGNVNEFTNQSIIGSQPGTDGAAWATYEWKDVQNTNNFLDYAPKSLPSSTNFPNIDTMTGSANGIGKIYSRYTATDKRYFCRGGKYNDSSRAGVLALSLLSTGTADSSIGFRVATR